MSTVSVRLVQSVLIGGKHTPAGESVDVPVALAVELESSGKGIREVPGSKPARPRSRPRARSGNGR